MLSVVKALTFKSDNWQGLNAWQNKFQITRTPGYALLSLVVRLNAGSFIFSFFNPLLSILNTKLFSIENWIYLHP